MPLRLLVIFSVFSAAAGPIHARDTPAYEIRQPAEWIRPLEVPETIAEPDSERQPGVEFRLIDIQVNAETEAKYFHFADEFINAAGIHRHSNLEIEFDPDFQRLILHRIEIHRAGVTLDVLKPEHIRIATPEDELDLGLLDGHLTALVVLPDVRPGDVVEYDYTITGRNPAFGDLFFDRFAMRWESPVGRVQYRILKKKERPLFFRNHLVEIEPERGDHPDEAFEEWIWKREKIPPLYLEDDVPGHHNPFAFIAVSELETWGDVAEWAGPLYDFSSEPLDPDLKWRTDRIREENPDAATRAMAAIRFVQDDVRYLGIEDGAAAFCPISPNETFRRRFGDCKDKTALLHCMLAELGIESNPVSVHLTRSVADQLPSPLAFNHVVLRIRLTEDQVFWCDPTRLLQGGNPKTLFFPRIGKGLAVDDGNAELVDLPDPDPLIHGTETVVDFYPGKPAESSRLEVVISYLGAEADSLRSYLASRDPEGIERDYLDLRRQSFDTVQPEGPLEIHDDRDKNRIVLRGTYRIDNLWTPDDSDPGWYFFRASLTSIRDGIRKPKTVTRAMPFAIPFPNRRAATIRFHVREPLEDWEDYFESENHFIEGPGLEFRRNVRYDSGQGILTIDGSLQTTTDAISPEEIREYRDRSDDIHDLTSYIIWDTTSDAVDPETEDAEANSPATGIRDWMIAMLCGIIGFGLGAMIVFMWARSRRKHRETAI